MVPLTIESFWSQPPDFMHVDLSEDATACPRQSSEESCCAGALAADESRLRQTSCAEAERRSLLLMPLSASTCANATLAMFAIWPKESGPQSPG